MSPTSVVSAAVPPLSHSSFRLLQNLLRGARYASGAGLELGLHHEPGQRCLPAGDHVSGDAIACAQNHVEPTSGPMVGFW